MDEASRRLDLYRYAVAEYSHEYLALMRQFTGTLFTDMSLAEAARALESEGIHLTDDEVAARCAKLEEWGNLVRSVRDARVSTVQEYLRSRARYQASKLGLRVHREIENLMATAEGAREVARELLGGIVETLNRIADALESERIDSEALASDVTTVFASQGLFQDSVRDFYAYLNQVLSRYDLAQGEYIAFKELLIDYVDLIQADVAQHAPAVSVGMARVNAHRSVLLQILAERPGLDLGDSIAVERLPGRSEQDWVRMTAWYDDSDGRSGPEQLRAAAHRALRQLLANAKRMLTASSAGVSRRADLLLLARWMHEADSETAHRIFDATFGAYPSRHLLMGPEELDPRVGVTTSWWDDPGVAVPVSLRERGERSTSGRSGRVPDPALERRLIQQQAQAEAEARDAAAGELVAVGALHGSRITAAARDLLLEMIAGLSAAHQEIEGPVERAHPAIALTLRMAPSDPGTLITSPDGQLHIEGFAVSVTSAAPAAGQLQVVGE